METNQGVQRLSTFAVLRALRRRKLYLIVPVLLFTAAASLYTVRQPERFLARTMIVSVPVIPANSWNSGSAAATTVIIQDQLRSIRETLLSDAVLQIINTEFHVASAAGRTPAQALEQIRSKIRIQVEGPDAFYISFEAERPQQAMQVTNRLAALFIERTSDLRGESVGRTDSFMDAEVERLQRQLREQEEGLKAYRQSVAHELPERLATNLKLLENLQQQVRSKTDQITEGQARRSAVLEEMKALEQQGALETGARERTPADAALDDLRARLRQLKSRYTARNPEIERVEKELRDLEASGTPPGTRREPSPVQMRYVALKAEAQSIDQRLQSYQQERTSLTAELRVSERRVDSSPGLETTLARRGREVALTRSQYEGMLAKLQESRMGQRLEKTTKGAAFKVAEAAQLPDRPSSPRRSRIILLGLIGGCGLGLLLILVVEQMDTTFDTIEEFQSFTNLPVLSAVPNIPSGAVRWRAGKGSGRDMQSSLTLENDTITPQQLRHYEENRITVLSDPRSLPSEQVRILAMKVEQWMDASGGRVLVVTSAAGGEGKSVTALNLSLALSSSMTGRVLLVDSDLRRPMTHRYLGLRAPKGFSDLLCRTDSDVASYISRVGNLDVILGGAPPPNPVGLLSSPRAGELLAQLRKEYQLIVLDSPPIIPIADSHVLSALGDGVVIVVRARQTRRELFRRAIQSLGTANVLGVVLNDVEFGDTRYAYAYRHYQRHYVDRT